MTRDGSSSSGSPQVPSPFGRKYKLEIMKLGNKSIVGTYKFGNLNSDNTVPVELGMDAQSAALLQSMGAKPPSTSIDLYKVTIHSPTNITIMNAKGPSRLTFENGRWYMVSDSGNKIPMIEA